VQGKKNNQLPPLANNVKQPGNRPFSHNSQINNSFSMDDAASSNSKIDVPINKVHLI
jgi:hypothetical protein